MRISDWSSDVCSSDLPSGLLPVYYRADGAGVTASSDAADLGRRGGVDYPAIARFLANGGAPSRETCLEGVQVLLPGECLIISLGSHRLESWWSPWDWTRVRSEAHTSELQSLMRISYAVFCLKHKKTHTFYINQHTNN